MSIKDEKPIPPQTIFLYESESFMSKEETELNTAKQISLLLVAIIVGITTIGFMCFWAFMAKVERVVQTTERIEARFQSFANEVQPVVSASAGKAIEAIQKVDADKLSETVTEKTDNLINSASDRAKRKISDKESFMPRGYIRSSGVMELGMINYNTLPDEGEDLGINHDMMLISLPDDEHLEMQVDGGQYVVHWWKKDWHGKHESIFYNTLNEACRGVFRLLKKAQIAWFSRHEGKN